MAESGGKRIGFLGIGIMGFQMARRLAQGGHAVTAWNRTPDKAERLASHGATIVREPVAAARDADIVILMLSDGPTCDAILDEAGVLAAMREDALLVVMSSIPVETARAQAERARERRVHFLDAPVSGGEKGATEGTLAIMTGGEAKAFERARPVLELMGRPTLVGPAGTGELAKLCNQMIVANTVATVAEAMLLAIRGGADPAAVREALLGGFADSTILKQHALRMIARDFAPGGPAKWQYKDTRTAMAFAQTVGLELPVSRLVDRLFADMIDHGDGELDHSGLIREIERRNGLSVVDAAD